MGGSFFSKLMAQMSDAPDAEQQTTLRKVLGGTGFSNPRISQLALEGSLGAYDPETDVISGVDLENENTLVHEGTHALQRRGRIPYAQWKPTGVPVYGLDENPYDYGGPETLKNLYQRNPRLTSPEHFSKEAQAEFVGDWASRSYTPWVKDMFGLTRKDPVPLTQSQVATYAPFVQHLKTRAIENTTPEEFQKPSYSTVVKSLWDRIAQ